MLGWIKKLFGNRDIHIYIHVDGDLNVKAQSHKETSERESRDSRGSEAYFKSEGLETRLESRLMEPGAKLDIHVPEADFGREE